MPTVAPTAPVPKKPVSYAKRLRTGVPRAAFERDVQLTERYPVSLE
jgi:hypothetical protein